MKSRIFCLVCVLFFSAGLSAQIRVKTQDLKGCHVLPCVVNGLKMDFILDTGAANVTIPLVQVEKMLEGGYLHAEDIVGFTTTESMFGEKIKKRIVWLRKFEVGGIKLKNIRAIIMNHPDAPLLLGMSVIRQLGDIQIEEDGLLFLDGKRTKEIAKGDAVALFREAYRDYDGKYDDLAVEVYDRAYAVSPGSFGYEDLCVIGKAHCRIQQYVQALPYLKKAAALCEMPEKSDWEVPMMLAKGYYELGEYERSADICQNVLSDIDALPPKERKGRKVIYEAMLLMGKNILGEGQYSEARQVYLRALTEYERLYGEKRPERGKDNRDKELGELYFGLGTCYQMEDNKTDTVYAMSAAVLFGNGKAKFWCLAMGVDWNQFWDI